MNYYKEYLKYVLEHKKNVFKVCWHKKMYLHALMHDLSKFNPKEFKTYAEWFNSPFGVKIKNKTDSEIVELSGSRYKHLVEALGLNGGFDFIKEEHNRLRENFDRAWQHHKDNNKHHWNYWSERNLEMPVKYIKQMICDWEAMGVKFGDTAIEFYLSNYDEIKLKQRSRVSLEWELGLIDSAMMVSAMTIKDTGFLEEDKIKYGIK